MGGRSVPQFDLALDALRAYRPELPVPDDLAAFWATTLADARSYPLDATFAPIDNGLAVVDTFDVTYRGFGGSPIRGWLHLPSSRHGPLPGVVEFGGYGSGRGLSHERIFWAIAGYAHLMMDTRGQGSSWFIGETPDPDGNGAAAQAGFMTQGVLDPATYYYRRVFTDAARAIEAIRSHDAVDSGRVAVAGGSQGGGISLAAAGLVPDLAGAMVDVPFLCDFPRATTLADTDPYGEIVRYLKAHRDHTERVARTLSYFDGAIMARSAVAPAIFSVGLMDDICPPSTVYAAFNAYAGPKEIREYPFNNHEGGQGFHEVEKLRWLAGRMAR
jgi:cephalosporin-C deacetylase